MSQTVLLGDPAFFHIKSGGNPHTRDRWGLRKPVDLSRALHQWNGLRSVLTAHGVTVHLLPAVREEPGLVYPANAGFRFGGVFYLSNLNPGRAGERQHYRQVIQALNLKVEDLPVAHPFEGEADFFPAADPSSRDPEKKVYLFTHGPMEERKWSFTLGFPPYRRRYGFRSSEAMLPALQSIVGKQEIIPIRLRDPAHYHGDTVLCPFGPREELLLAYLDGVCADSAQLLTRRFRDRLISLGPSDGRAFAANSFQISVSHGGEKVPVLVMPDGLTQGLYGEVRRRGVIPCPVDVSEFLEKGGGAVKCMLLRLGEL